VDYFSTSCWCLGSMYSYMDWIHFWIIQIAFWVGLRLGPIQVEPRQSRPMSSRQAWADLGSYGPGSMSSCTGPGRSRVVRGRADLESYGPGSMSSRMGPGRCRVVRVWADLWSYGSGSMSSRTGLGRCRVVRTWANVESNWSGSMSSRTGPG